MRSGWEHSARSANIQTGAFHIMNEEIPASRADRFNAYQLVRNEIAHEDNLMAARLSWFAALQSFLLTAMAIAQGGGGLHHFPSMATNYFFPLIPIVALGSTLLILAGVLAGIRTLVRWRRIVREDPDLSAGFPRVVKDQSMIALGWAAPVGLPLIFLCAWVYLLIAGLHANP